MANRKSSIHISSTVSFSYIVKYFLFVNDLKMHCSIYSVHDCKFLQYDIDSVQNWCFENGMINQFYTRIHKTISIKFSYKLCNNIFYIHRVS
jgi:hypothetical protein